MNFDMGSYGVYIWPAYGATALGLLGAVVVTLKAYGDAKARLKKLEEKKP